MTKGCIFNDLGFRSINAVVTVTALDANLLAFFSSLQEGKAVVYNFRAERLSRSYPWRLKHTRRVT
jgi:hypothetical protein